MTLRNTLLGAAAAVGLVLSAGAANASIIANLTNVTAGSTNGTFNFNYTATLDANEQIATGSYLTLYDFGAATYSVANSTGTIASGFSFSQALVGPTPSQVVPVDSATVLNATLTYNGAATITGSSLSNGASGNLGSFTLTSTLTGSNPNGNQASSAQKFAASGSGTGNPDGNVTSVTVPAASSVPEPASLAILGGALALAGFVRRRRSV